MGLVTQEAGGGDAGGFWLGVGQPGDPEARPHRAPSWAPEWSRAAGRAGCGRGVSSCRRHWVWGGGQTYKPTTRGTPGRGPPGCLLHSADTTTPPKAAKTSGGTGQAPARPTSAAEGGWGRCRGGWGRISWGREWGGPQRKEMSVASSTRLAQMPHAQPGLDPGGQRMDTLFPTEAGRPACPHPASGAPPHPSTGRQAWGSSHNADPHSCSRAADGGSRTPRTQFRLPQPTNAGFRGVRQKNGPEGAHDGAEAFTLRDPAQDAGPAGPGGTLTREGADGHTTTAPSQGADTRPLPTSGAHETPATQGASLPRVLQAPASCPLPAAECPQVPPALDAAGLPQCARPTEDPLPLPSPWASWVGSRPPVH